MSLRNNSATVLTESLKKPSVLFIIFTCCFIFWFNDFLKPYQASKNETNFVWDAAGYYSYLPAMFYYHGSFQFENFYQGFLPINSSGQSYPKYTYGVALLEAPFYALGFIKAYIQNKDLNGFSSPFNDAIRIGGFVYLIIGLYFLRKFLLLFYDEITTAISLFAALFGSMLYYYTLIQPELSHGYLFTLFAVFMFLTVKWHTHPNHFTSICLASLLGLISVVRSTDVYIFIFFIFWNVKSVSDVKIKYSFFRKHYQYLFWFPIIGFAFWIPQLIFWKHYVGSYFFDPYPGERFFWNDPQIMNILFSYRKGWMLYTPIVVLCCLGLPFIKKDFPFSKLLIVFILCLCIYIFSCWWDWVYGGSFSSRPFCPLIALLTIPFASLTQTILNIKTRSRRLKLIMPVFFVFVFSCSLLNISQSYQLQTQRVIHTYNMSKFIYWGSFRQFHYGKEFVNPYWAMLHYRNENAWLKGEERDDKINTVPKQ